MASLSQAKTLGGIGSILVLLGGFVSFVIPYGGAVAPIIGLIMTIIAVKNISEVVQAPSIFKNILIGIVVAIVGAVIAFAIVIVAVLKNLSALTALRTSTTTTITGTSSLPPGVLGVALDIIFGFILLWIIFIVSSIFVRRGYKEISQKLNVSLFGTAALIYLIGAILTIVLIGLIIIFVAQILLVVAFFSIPESVSGVAWTDTSTYPAPPPPPGSMQPPPPATPSTPAPQWSQGATCPNCGAPVTQDTIFCPSCGSRLKQ